MSELKYISLGFVMAGALLSMLVYVPLFLAAAAAGDGTAPTYAALAAASWLTFSYAYRRTRGYVYGGPRRP